MLTLHGDAVTIRDLISIPFSGPGAIGAHVANALIADGVDIMGVNGRALRRGTPVYVNADSPPEDAMGRLKELRGGVIPVLQGLKLLGFLDLSEGDPKGRKRPPSRNA